MRTEQTMPRSNPTRPGIGENADRGVATVGTVASIAALFSAAACCILPLGLAAIGVGSAGLSSIVPLHWPLTIAAIAAVAAGWFFYLRKRRSCMGDASCTTAPPAKSTFILLCLATVIIAISACWGFIEAPLMRALGGA